MAAFHCRVSRLLFTAAFFSGILLWTSIFIPLSPFLWAWLFAVKTHDRAVALRVMIHIYGQGVCVLMGMLTPIKVHGMASAFPRPCIVTPNHQSFFDPYCIGFLPVRNLVFAVRSWPFRIPLYGPLMRRVGYLNTETLNAEEFFSKAKGLLAEGCTIILFPEGTRSKDGRLGRFRSGAFALAMETGVPIVPLCIDGTGRVFPKGEYIGRAAPIRIRVLEPVFPETFEKYGDAGHLRLRRHVKTAMESAMARQTAVHP